MTTFTRNLLATLFAIVLIAMVGLGLWLRPDDDAGPCVVVQRAALPEIPEASGLAISRRHPGIIWSHNDSGNAAVLFALDAAGAVTGRVRLPISTRDWEAIAVGRCSAGDCLYIGDIGDNRRTRKRIQIYRVPEPALSDTETTSLEVFDATYADGPHNAEALFVINDDIFVVTRDRIGSLYKAARAGSGSRALTLEHVGDFGLEAVTDAAATPDEHSIVVRTSHDAIVYRTADVLRGGRIPLGDRIPLDGLGEPQGEGVALGSDRTLYLASEGRPWSRAGRLIALRCTLP